MKKRYSENDLKKIVENYKNGEFVLLSIIENKGLKSKILVKHKKCNRELEIILYNLVNLNRGCKFCDSNRMDSTKIKSLIDKNFEYKSISCGNSVKDYAEILHKKCNNIFKMKPADFLYNNYRCPKCFKKEVYTKESIMNKLKDFPDYTCIDILEDETKRPSRWKMILRHNICKTDSIITVHNFFSNNQRCKECSKKKLGFSGNSKQAKIIEEYLNDKNITFEKEKTFSNMVFKKNLRLDFYIEISSRKIAIEYDGKQHFETNKSNKIFTKDKLEIQKQRDNIKDNFCKKNNIELYRFNYKESNEEILNKLKLIFQSEVSE